MIIKFCGLMIALFFFIFLHKNESLVEAGDLHYPDFIGQEIVDDLEADLDQSSITCRPSVDARFVQHPYNLAVMHTRNSI
jgi:hypothetical protein